jgi:hypothetical protein
MPTSPWPVNPELSAIAIGYRNRDIDLIADRVLPRVQRGGKQFRYTIYPAAEAYTIPNTRVGRKGEPTQIDFSGTLVNGECLDYGLEDVLPVDDIQAWEAMPKPASGGPVSPEAKATSLLTSLLMLDREVRVANLVFNAATYPAANRVTLSGTSQWSDFANSNPLDALLAGLDVPLMRPNVLVLGQAVWTKLRQHPRIVQAVYGTSQTGGAIMREQLAALLEVREVLVGAGFVNTARRGQAANIQRVWGKHCAALYVSEDAADADQPTFGFTAQFGERIAGAMDEPRKGLRGARVIRVGESVLEVVSAPASAYYWADAVA